MNTKEPVRIRTAKAYAHWCHMVLLAIEHGVPTSDLQPGRSWGYRRVDRQTELLRARIQEKRGTSGVE